MKELEEVGTIEERGEMARATKGRRWGRREKGLRDGIRDYVKGSLFLPYLLS